ncbi:cytochrome c oxidase assembly protein [Nocardioides daphniae]|uniref:ABC transporter permease n=1 Tax=Nocardioides daphniae TaxID=402297 RepID=A0A4V1CW48_9ACTN|nr:cytochrome c oxidase assembly protein [Nocardioides daphniae]QCC76017.1 copper resistance protein CopD [Nocardioides daphniae]GGD11085.1 ABC transporter permease [Nocardioides daphniae]
MTTQPDSETSSPGAASPRRGGSLFLLIVVLATAVSAVALLALTGGIAGAPAPGLPDPGALTRWGLPATRAVRDSATFLTLGALVVATCMVATRKSGLVSKVQLRLAAMAVISGSVWLWSAVMEFVLSYADISGQEPQTATTEQLRFFATEIEQGSYLGWNIVLAGVATFIALAARTVTGLALAAVLTLAALWAVALTGHAAADANHDLAVNIQFLHLVGIGLWIGCLVAALWIRRHPDTDLPVLVARYSRLAGWCFVAVAISGVLAALLRVPRVSDLASSYGLLLGVKVAAFGLLGALGWWQRTRVVGRLAEEADQSSARTLFTRLAALEVAFMALAAGAGTALSRTPPPGIEAADEPTPTEALLGHSMPPELGFAQWFTEWRIDSFWAPIAVAAALVYVAGVRRLSRRGDRWSRGRMIAWLVGCLGLLWATSGPPGAYGDVLFSMHMIQHMTVATAVPTFFVLGAPVTLALRAVVRRVDGSRGPREWLLLIVHSWPLRILGHPIVAGILFVVGMIAFYYSSLFEQSLRGHTMHLLMTAHFLLTGYLFANVVCGVDPGPRRPIYPLRVLLIMVVFGFHALFAVALMGATELLAGDWFTALDRPWGPSPADDQYVGASLGWVLGEYPLVILAVAVVWAWVRDDHREAKRLDRQADRDNGQELARYNEFLQGLGRSSTNEGHDR